MSFFRLDPNYGKSSNKTNKMFPLSQDQQDSEGMQHNLLKQVECMKCKRSFEIPRGLQQHLRDCKETQTVIAKTIEKAFPGKTYRMLIVTYFLKKSLVHTIQSFTREITLFIALEISWETFIEEMIRLVNCWTCKTEQYSIAMKALMILPILLLQKIKFKLKT